MTLQTSTTGLTAAQLQERRLAEAGVAALAGTAFGPAGEGLLRFSYANSLENIQVALGAVQGCLAGLTAPGAARE